MANDIVERLRKVRALALNGVPGGEKEVAQALLDKLMKKYNVSLSELEDEDIKKYLFTYHGKEQKQLLIQVVFSVLNKVSSCIPQYYTASGRKCRTQLGVYCTAAQAVEIGFLYDFYVVLWEKEKEAFLDAYIQKHKLFGQTPDDMQPTEISDSELSKMYAFMNGMSDDSPHKRIEANTSATED